MDHLRYKLSILGPTWDMGMFLSLENTTTPVASLVSLAHEELLAQLAVLLMPDEPIEESELLVVSLNYQFLEFSADG